MAETCSKASSDKSLLRLIKLLSSAPRNRGAIARDGDVILVQKAEKSCRFSGQVVQNAIQENLIRLCADELVLTAEGSAFLKRALYPDAAYQAQHAELVTSTIRMDKEIQSVVKNRDESPLSRLFTRKERNGSTWLNAAQFQAGERIRMDFEKANLRPKISANWDVSVATGNGGRNTGDISDFALDARRRLDKALTEIGPDLADVTLDICCFLKGLETVEREKKWPPRSAKLLLRTALNALARHYGLVSSNSNTTAHKIRKWATEDYRPSFSQG